MQAATQDSVGAIKEITATIDRISEIATVIAAAVDEQGAATQEISQSVQQVARGTATVAGNITDVSRGASETGLGVGTGAYLCPGVVERKQSPQGGG